MNMKTIILLVDRVKITRPGLLENISFEWWYLLFIPVYIFGL